MARRLAPCFVKPSNLSALLLSFPCGGSSWQQRTEPPGAAYPEQFAGAGHCHIQQPALAFYMLSATNKVIIIA